jgi:hypothetical protein
VLEQRTLGPRKMAKGEQIEANPQGPWHWEIGDKEALVASRPPTSQLRSLVMRCGAGSEEMEGRKKAKGTPS